jgi:dihydropteroate synthase
MRREDLIGKDFIWAECSIESDMAFVRRDEFLWRLRTRSLALGRRTLVMGVLNVTPDSFSDGGRFADTEAAATEALLMFGEGANIVDIGGESTRPGKHAAVTAEEEQRRVLPVIAAVLKARPDSLLSVDTYKGSTAEAAVLAGAEIVNDISGFGWDELLPSACARLGCGVVLVHTRGRPAEWRSLSALAPEEVLPLVERGLEQSLDIAQKAGVVRERIVLDPGYGFGKSFDENYPLLAHQGKLRSLGRPILAGVSRKSFLGRTLAEFHGGSWAAPDERAHATLAATTAAILAGAHIVRVHEVGPAVEAARIADAILAAV